MARRLPSLSGLAAFEAAARHLSFQDAADELAITPTAISHRIRRLEEELGIRLFERRPRAIALTATGEALLPDIETAFARLRRAAERVGVREDPGVVTVSTVPSFAVKWLVPKLGDFQRAHPDIDIRLTTSLALANFVTDGVDIAIRYGRGDWPGVKVERLMREDWRPVCAPSLVAGDPPLREPPDLARHTLLHVAIYPDDWRRWLTMAGYPELTAARNLTFDDTATAQQAALDGLGVAMGFRAYTEVDLEAGRLVHPFAIQLPRDTAFYVVAPERNLGRAKVAAFRDWILNAVPEETR